ncbi:MAG: hypothetical protein IT303_02080 [Dehalococcoidia bacterium]|nr:hypothetical protein [Dehalococcoidia bacterium]
MILVGAVVMAAMLMSWSPLQRVLPSESLTAFLLVGVIVVAFFQAGLLD